MKAIWLKKRYFCLIHKLVRTHGNMLLSITAFSCFTQLAVSLKKQSNIASAFVEAAPVALGKALTDIPKSTADSFVRQILSGEVNKKTLAKSVTKAFTGVGLGRSTGALIGALATGPLFVSAMRDLESDDKKRRRKGLAKLILSSGIVASSEGVLEAIARSGWKLTAEAKQGIRSLLKARTLAGIAAGIATAKAIAKERREEQEKPKTFFERSIRPAAVGASVGAAKGALDVLAEMHTQHGSRMFSAMRELVKQPKQLYKTFVPTMAGRATAGIIGAIGLAEILRKALPIQTKKQSSLYKVAQQQQEKEEEGIVIPGMNEQYKLLPHQQRFIEKFLGNKGRIVAAHATGTGKTFSSIAAEHLLQLLGKSQGALVVVPAALRKNYVDSIKKFVPGASIQVIGPKNEPGSVYPTEAKPGHNFTVVSYEMLHKYPQIGQQVGANTLIIDEYHRLRNARGELYKTLMGIRPNFKYFIGMTGSLINNEPAEIASLMNLAVGQEVIHPSRFKKIFAQRQIELKNIFGGTKKFPIYSNVGILGEIYPPLIDIAESNEGKPRKAVEVVKVPMSSEQRDAYEYVLKRLNPIIAWKIRHNVDVSDEEIAHIFQMLTLARAVANSPSALKLDVPKEVAAESSPKIKTLVNDVVKELNSVPDAQIVIYSNLVRNGLDLVAAALKNRGIPFGTFLGRGENLPGSVSQNRIENLEQFKAGKIKVLLISPAGAEGLDLPNATHFFSLDGHFNPERIRQAEARAIRHGGLAHRPPEQRVVKVRRYVSTVEPDFLGRLFGNKETSVDEWIYNVAARKARINEIFKKELIHSLPERRMPIQVALNELKQRGIMLEKKPGTKYEARYRTPEGKIVYDYPKQPA